MVTLLTRASCGSCARVLEQIRPVVDRAGATLEVVDVESPSAFAGAAAEFGDRVPVVLVDGAEFACWEVDNEDLAAALGAAE
ncbi:glutaredoxin family protein [Corynebacterium heidelbergense]|uniref:Thioredoxin family protein n=1 Tax=Corynebacterium heidelbergense TaxID=2055947 RepID=A0A364VEH6_9CORY|nr:glutaredoxin family protein [Corynebacterium heidelbergense]RAV35050.1 thioredoxin family protein [Corynebacterium heidelbergense]WCZ37398.1 hypothetical protein CHEID_09360 [Corynebacterium heidelbergense]